MMSDLCVVAIEEGFLLWSGFENFGGDEIL
jgi:hypothetical protein